MHVMDEVDENLVVDGLAIADVSLKRSPDPVDKLEPILALQLPTVPFHILDPIHGRKPRRGGQQPFLDPSKVCGIEIQLKSVGELLDCPGNERNHTAPPDAVIAILISVHRRPEFDIPKYGNALDGSIGLSFANLFGERSLEGRAGESYDRLLGTIPGTGKNIRAKLEIGLGIGRIERHLREPQYCLLLDLRTGINIIWGVVRRSVPGFFS
jgi:hypothetical protein